MAEAESQVSLPSVLKTELLIYQNKQLSRLVREMRRRIKELSPTDAGDNTDDQGSTISDLQCKLEDLKQEKLALYTRLSRSLAALSCSRPETPNHDIPNAPSAPQIDMTDSTVPNEPQPSAVNCDEQRSEIVRLQSVISKLKCGNQIAPESETSYEMEIFNITSDRNVWMQKTKKAEANLRTYREMIEGKLADLMQTAQTTEQTYLTEVERMSEEVVQRNQEVRKYQQQIAELEVKLKSANDSFSDHQSEIKWEAEPPRGSEAAALNEKLKESGILLTKCRDQLRIKEEQCSRLLAQHVHLQHQLTSVEQENGILRGHSQTAADFIASVTERLGSVDSQKSKESSLVQSLEAECKIESALRTKLIEDLTDVNSKLAQLKDVHSSVNAVITELQSEHQSTLKEVAELKRQKTDSGLLRQSSNFGSLLLMELEEIRTKIKCSLCQSRNKSVALTTCMHCFCRECVDEKMLNARNRKCPLCMQRFSDAEVREVHFFKD